MARSHDGRKRTWRFPLRDGATLEVATPPRATEKQVRRRGRVSLVLSVLVAATAIAAVAYADNVVNDVQAGVNDTITAGGSLDVEYWIVATAMTCDAADGSAATVTINVPANVSVDTSGSPGSQNTMTFTSCGTSSAQTATFTSAVAGSYATTCSVSDSSGTYNVSPCAFTLHVQAATEENDPPVVDAGGPYSGAEGSDIAIDGASASDADDDPLTYSWTKDETGIDAGGSCSLTGADTLSPSLNCNDNGTVTLTLTVDDGQGHDPLSSDTATVNVGNADPIVTAFACPTDPVAVNTQVTLNGTYTDAGSNDTHTASIAWGDGTTTNPSATGGGVTGGHTYTAAGIYTPQLTVTDDDGGADSEGCEYVVVYDPSAGFVTGGGWINSPAGAYMADLNLTGKATFGFVSKYKKGANTPDGNTEFQFHAAGLNFKSTAYQWLVVSGSKATYKGWGTINGGGNYGFLLSALDGSPDKFRIKIWDVGTGDIVYDNNLNGGDDADPATALGGGSIVIHTGGNK